MLINDARDFWILASISFALLSVIAVQLPKYVNQSTFSIGLPFILISVGIIGSSVAIYLDFNELSSRPTFFASISMLPIIA